MKTQSSYGVMFMKTKSPGVERVAHEPESMQKYSDEVRERIAKKAYELYERQVERDVEDWLKAEELVRKEMNETCS
jgi:exoribonuclease II